ncbi:unnamed protein product [Owenia fusiformis]|uniref:Uncharacterized protein n=1 Tax=Owenia fusiformis TaxID=6347 RepID=A0A8S4N0H1_OWEFU|nr:unnamed protein product [Owenia fusiformis]
MIENDALDSAFTTMSNNLTTVNLSKMTENDALDSTFTTMSNNLTTVNQSKVTENDALDSTFTTMSNNLTTVNQSKVTENDALDSTFTTMSNNLTSVNQSLDVINTNCVYYNRTASIFVIILCSIAMYIQINWLVLAYRGKRLHMRENLFHFVQVFVHICGIIKELIIAIFVMLDYDKCTQPAAFAWIKYLPMCMLSMKYICLIGIVRIVKVTKPYKRIPWWIMCTMSAIQFLYIAILAVIPQNDNLVWVVNTADISCFILTVIVHSKAVWSLRKKLRKVHFQPHVSSSEAKACSQTKSPVGIFQIHPGGTVNDSQSQSNAPDNVSQIHIDIKDEGGNNTSPVDIFQIHPVDNGNGSQCQSNTPNDVSQIHIEIDLNEEKNNKSSNPELSNNKGGMMYNEIYNIGNFEKINNEQGINAPKLYNHGDKMDECQRKNSPSIISMIRKWKTSKSKVSPASSKVFRKTTSGRKCNEDQSQFSINHPSRRGELFSEYKMIFSEVVMLIFGTAFHTVLHITLRMTDIQLFKLVYTIYVLCFYSAIQLMTLFTSQVIRQLFMKCYLRKK